MPSKTNEQDLEAAIEKALTGTCLEELKTVENEICESTDLRGGIGYYIGYAGENFIGSAVPAYIWHRSS